MAQPAEADASLAEVPAAPLTAPPVMADPPTNPSQHPDEIPGSPAATTLPPGFADLTKTTKLEINDSWNGMGATHDLLAMLEREPGARTFTVDAKVRAHGWPPFEESSPDPTATRRRSEMNASSQPQRIDYKTKKTTIDAAVVEAFLAEVATRQIDPKQDHAIGSMWTDDYPSGHVAVWVPGDGVPIHLAFRDQQRHWRVNGAFITVDPGSEGSQKVEDTIRGAGVHKKINERYRAMLKAMGLDAWVKEAHARRGR